MQDTSTVIREIQQGNEHLREEFLISQKEFIRRYASFVCRSRLDWHNDDELSIALIAFNKAVDTYNPEMRKSFSGYARALIRNSLIDHFRSRQKSQPYTLAGPNDSDTSLHNLETAASLNSYQQELEKKERAYEIGRFKELLSQFGFSLAELIQNSPRHNDTREKLKAIALRVVKEPVLVKRLYQEKRLPLKEIQLLTGANRKLLEKWRRYLLSLILISSHEEMEGLAEYIRW